MGVHHGEAHEHCEALRGIEVARADTASDASEEGLDTQRIIATAGAQRLHRSNPELGLLATETEPAG